MRTTKYWLGMLTTLVLAGNAHALTNWNTSSTAVYNIDSENSASSTNLYPLGLTSIDFNLASPATVAYDLGLSHGSAGVSLWSLTSTNIWTFVGTISTLLPTFPPIDTAFLSSKGVLSGDWSLGSGQYALIFTDFSGAPTLGLSGTLSVAAVPEPSTYALMICGLFVIGYFMYRRREHPRR
jgi:hypothetical protein